MKSSWVISAAVAPIHKEAGFTSEMVTQGLMFESVRILSKKDSWYNIKMEDEYEGWIHQFYLSETQVNYQNSLLLTNRHTPIRAQWDRDGQIQALLSFATVVPLIEKTSEYCKIELINGEEGFIPTQRNMALEARDNIIRLANSLLGVPYLWGGKSAFGYDCSGFVQMVLKTVGVSMPRDTGLQIKSDSLEEISITETLSGDLAFFSKDNHINHVAFIIGDGNIIHCSGEVKLESIIEGEPGFNSTLAKLDHTYTSIAKVVDP